jgi:hypothetical protein
MIEALFDKTVDVYRLAAEDESPNDTEDYAAFLSGVACNIQPVDDSFREDMIGGYIKEFLMFCPVCDIQEKDRIVDGYDTYIVSGVKSFSLLGQSHMELRIAKTQ